MDEKIHRIHKNIDIVDFVENMFEIKLFRYQKIILRLMYSNANYKKHYEHFCKIVFKENKRGAINEIYINGCEYIVNGDGRKSVDQ